MFRRRDSNLQVFLVHPGGPFWKEKDAGAWSIPKGEYEDGEEPLEAAKREFEEETGIKADGEFVALGQTKQSSAKLTMHCETHFYVLRVLSAERRKMH